MQNFQHLLKVPLKLVINSKKNFTKPTVVYPQGNIISPILNNIYLYKFDNFTQSTKEQFSKGKSRPRNPQYRKIEYRITKTQLNKQKKAMRNQLWKVRSKDPMDFNFKRLFDTRYVNNFVVGIKSSRKDALDIKSKIAQFLKNDLNLNSNE